MNSRQLLEKLIGFPTVSRDSNLALISFIANLLEDLGIQSTLVYNEEQTKANLYAVLGPEDIPGIMLSGHSDVVPTDGQAWTVDPFSARTIDDKLFGRGATDMKGFIACVLAMLPEAAKRNLEKPIHLSFSYDEEIGCVGVRGLIDRLKADTESIAPEFCIIGEPTSMQPAIAHKGKTAARCQCTGVASHSALTDRGLNAIYLATDMISEIRAMQQRIIEHGVRDPMYDVPYTTLHVGTIDGGTVVNIVPDHCGFGFEIRNLAADNPDALIERLNDAAADIAERYRAQFADAAIDIEVYNQYPALETRADAKAVALVQDLSRNNTLGKLAFGTEGGLFQQQLHLPTVVCGPGSMDQGHKPDEFIHLSQLEACDQFLNRLLNQIS